MTASAAQYPAETLAALRAAVLPDPNLAARCEDPLAKCFIHPTLRALAELAPRFLVKQVLNLAAPGSYGFTIARTRHFDEVLLAELRAGVSQVVIIGAGFDTRALRFADRLAGVKVYEIDHPQTQAHKRQVLQDAGARRSPDLIYVPVDIGRESFAQALSREGFNMRRKTVFLWEGGAYCHSRSVAEEVLAYVGNCAPGSSITFDYATRRFVDGDTSGYGGRQAVQWLKRIGELPTFGLDPGETAAFLSERKLQLDADLGPEDAERAYLRSPSGSRLGRCLGHIRMALGRAQAAH